MTRIPSRKFVAPRSCNLSRSGRTKATRRALVLQRRDLGYFGGAAIDSLQILGGHLLAPAQHEYLLRPAGDKEETVAIDKAQIPGPVPPVGRERRAIGIGIVEIAVRDRAPAQLDLADPRFV